MAQASRTFSKEGHGTGYGTLDAEAEAVHMDDVDYSNPFFPLAFFLSPRGYLVCNFSVFLSPRQPDTAPTPTPTPYYARYVGHATNSYYCSNRKGILRGGCLPLLFMAARASKLIRFGFGESCKRALKRYIWDTSTDASARVSFRRCPPPVHQAVEEGLQVLRVHVRRRFRGLLRCRAARLGRRAIGLAFLGIL